MNYNFKRNHHNPIKLIKEFWPLADIGHIEYDPNMKANEKQYSIIRQCSHDGTILFTNQLLQKCLLPIVNMNSYYKPTAPGDFNELRAIKYRISSIRHSIVFGMVDINGKRMHGQRERVSIRIVCEYVYL